MLQGWIRTPSVKEEAESGAPFGRDVRKMLDRAMADAKSLGFAVRDFDGYACDITLGDAEEKIAVLGHLDVVPVGDGWTKPPFDAVIENGRMYGRGTNDDKGPSLAALFAMKAVRDAGIPLKKSIRMILGCDEESGWEDMEYYGAHEKIPDVGFSPDASFPLINTEKGMLVQELRAPAASTGLKILKLSTGDRINVIPGECCAVVEGGEELVRKTEAYAAKTGLPYTAEVTGEGVLLTALGIPGHSAYPEGRRNAIGMMLLLLRELGARRKEPGLRLPGRCLQGPDLQHGDPSPGERRMVRHPGYALPGHGRPGEAEKGNGRAPAGHSRDRGYAEAAAPCAGGQRAGHCPAHVL